MRIDYDTSTPKKRSAALQEILRRVTEIPGIEAAGIADMLPLGRNRSWGLEAKGKTYAKDDVLQALVRIVTPGYLSAMGMQLREGRDFTWQDQPSVILNETAARRYWQGDDALGRFAKVNGADFRVIGIIADVREHSVESTAGPEMYLLATQADPEGAELVLRMRLPAESLAGTVMRTLRELNPGQPAAELRPLQHIVDRAVSPRRFFVLLVTAFAGLGLVLAAMGIYGVISYTVTQQTQEIGIRMALGASGGQVQMSVIRRALRLALAGALIGVV